MLQQVVAHVSSVDPGCWDPTFQPRRRCWHGQPSRAAAAREFPLLSLLAFVFCLIWPFEFPLVPNFSSPSPSTRSSLSPHRGSLGASRLPPSGRKKQTNTKRRSESKSSGTLHVAIPRTPPTPAAAARIPPWARASATPALTPLSRRRGAVAAIALAEPLLRPRRRWPWSGPADGMVLAAICFSSDLSVLVVICALFG